jgi:predicted O-methyltransferase YrrM
MSEDSIAFARDVLERLTPTRENDASRLHYSWGQKKFGPHWRYADVLTVLRAASTLIGPAAYLEIGVRRGRSAAMVGATCPQCAIYGFDLWLPDYAGAPNPGPDFVRSELRAVGHRGSVELISGDSRKTVPAFLRQHPDLYFDLINVDGDHSVLGAASDLANTLPRLKVGGIVVFDDISSAPRLRRVWRKNIERNRRYMSWEFTESRYGVAAAVRVSEPRLAAPPS